MKGLFWMLYIISFIGHAATDTTSALITRDAMLQQLQMFNPNASIPSFNSTPPESTISLAEEDEKILKHLGVERAAQDKTSDFVLHQENIRTKTNSDVLDKELNEAEQLLNKETSSIEDSALDQTQSIVSDDVNEGVTQLGVLAGIAQEVAANPHVFQGQYQECEKYMFGTRDCCKDDGWMDGMINCPSALQTLQRAKAEHRAIYLGHYKPRRFSTTRFGYCVFPSKLAGIIQIQGRFGQLGIGFGSVWHPDCRGMSADELARLDFKRLDISGLVQDFTSKKVLPSNAALDNQGQNHVNLLYQKGASHD